MEALCSYSSRTENIHLFLRSDHAFIKGHDVNVSLICGSVDISHIEREVDLRRCQVAEVRSLADVPGGPGFRRARLDPGQP
jgi:hypothetical protein